MEEKKVTKISLSTYLLVIAIFAIVVMGALIYKLNNDKTAEIQKSTNLQAQVNSLNGTVSDLQGKINTISETVNSSISKDNSTLSNKTTNTNNSSSTNEESNSKTSEKKYKDVILSGTYGFPNSDHGWEFTKDGKAYSCDNMGIMKGTYKTTEKNSVEIHYTEGKEWDETTGEEKIKTINIYEYITIDNNGNIYWKNQNNENLKIQKLNDTTPNAY